MLNCKKKIRFFDLCFSILGLLCLSPLFLLLFIIGLIETGRPLIFQERVGKNQKSFYLVKFRTMKIGAAVVPTHLSNISEVTRFGSILRKTKLDELPQLINVFLGDMSLVGPRPCLPSQAELIELRRENNIFSVLPGITGLSQIKNIDMSDPVLLTRTDKLFVQKLSLIVYFKCVVFTLVGKGSGDPIGIG